MDKSGLQSESAHRTWVLADSFSPHSHLEGFNQLQVLGMYRIKFFLIWLEPKLKPDNVTAAPLLHMLMMCIKSSNLCTNCSVLMTVISLVLLLPPLR